MYAKPNEGVFNAKLKCRLFKVTFGNLGNLLFIYDQLSLQNKDQNDEGKMQVFNIMALNYLNYIIDKYIYIIKIKALQTK